LTLEFGAQCDLEEFGCRQAALHQLVVEVIARRIRDRVLDRVS
jgi:putative lipoic acid-binding regulatory protein